MSVIRRVQGVLKHYDWGSTSALYELCDLPGTGHPAAELWLGTHPAGHATLADRDVAYPSGHPDVPLETVLTGPLPYLLKVLAAEQPLSLQVHPTRPQATLGFDRENSLGIALDAPHRTYRDRGAKPELIVALTPFRALAGVRDRAATIAVSQALGLPELTAILTAHPDGPTWAREVLADLLALPADTAHALVEQAVAAAAAVDEQGTHDDLDKACTLLPLLHSIHPGDSGVLAALLLNDVTLMPGQGLYQDAGILHAYVHGVGIEIMAASDNVLRGGLTTKHIDVPELLAILDPRTGPAPVVLADSTDTAGGVVRTWPTPAEHFALRELDLTHDHSGAELQEPVPGQPVYLQVHAPTIVLVVEGTLTLADRGQELVLSKGQAAVCDLDADDRSSGAACGAVQVTGRGRMFTASTPAATPAAPTPAGSAD